MRICDDLRQAVLQAAIQGKLTKQLPEDGNAADLLKHKHPLTNDEEKPFELPSSWIWVRLGDIGSFTRGSGIKRSEVTSEGFPCIRYGQLYTTYHNKISEVRSKTSETVFKKSKKIKHGDIVMALTGENNYDIALAAAYIGHDTVAIGGDMTAFTHNVNPLYLVIAINSSYGIKCKSKLATGNIIVHISNDKLASIPFPLPPLAEQHRIVARIEELMTRIDDLEKTETELEKLKTAFPGDMKAALLQAAMQGKLTEQLPEDGDAADLINQIAKEKSRLIKEGKIKKEKPLPEITPDEMPFDIPENWQWVRFNDLINIYGGLAYKKGTLDIKSQQMVKVLRGGNILDIGYTFRTDDVEISSEFITNNELYLKKNQLITPAVTSLEKLGKVARIEKDYPDVVAGGFVLNLCPYLCNDILSTYLMYFFASPYLKQRCHDIAKKSGQAFYNLSRNKLLETAVAIPPPAEQKRIVEKLDKLLPLCDGLVEE